jgi:hypothetical protein
MKKIALFVSMVVIFGGLYTFAYLNNSKSINASNGLLSAKPVNVKIQQNVKKKVNVMVNVKNQRVAAQPPVNLSNSKSRILSPIPLPAARTRKINNCQKKY